MSIVLDLLRTRIRSLESAPRHAGRVLPFGVDALDALLPSGGLGCGMLHEASGDLAASSGFFAGIAARAGAASLWMGLRPANWHLAGLAQCGLDPARVIWLEAPDAPCLFACAEEALRHPGSAVVVIELAELPMLESRRLQLAAEAGGGLGLVLRRSTRPPANPKVSNCAATRWRIEPALSAPLPVPGVGRPRWNVALWRNRGGQTGNFLLDGCDEQGHLAVPAAFPHRPVAAEQRRSA